MAENNYILQRDGMLDVAFTGLPLADATTDTDIVTIYRTKNDAYILHEKLHNTWGNETNVYVGKNPQEFIDSICNGEYFIEPLIKECLMKAMKVDDKLAAVALEFIA